MFLIFSTEKWTSSSNTAFCCVYFIALLHWRNIKQKLWKANYRPGKEKEIPLNYSNFWMNTKINAYEWNSCLAQHVNPSEKFCSTTWKKWNLSLLGWIMLAQYTPASCANRVSIFERVFLNCLTFVFKILTKILETVSITIKATANSWDFAQSKL